MSLNFFDNKLRGVQQYRCALRPAMVNYYVKEEGEGNTLENVFIACGSENSKVLVWGHDPLQESSTDVLDESAYQRRLFAHKIVERLSVAELRGHMAAVNSVVWIPNRPGILLSASDDGQVCCWGS